MRDNSREVFHLFKLAGSLTTRKPYRRRDLFDKSWTVLFTIIKLRARIRGQVSKVFGWEQIEGYFASKTSNFVYDKAKLLILRRN